ncbi:hypothetical protein JK358_06635 [Nocardia sp. 2]|uniref:KOW domain-containing protein n=1 Tax=Nocardia acididurans TaxID=2802282 RepID=A0ABS1M076_9NOCA|nr:hypothetical protein [Nocardia acididurans]MBL1074068.1 hypothetical protein [Nocardia acididurans]
MGIPDFGPGDVIYFPAGPFAGVCGVVREVDMRKSQLRIDFREGTVHREGNVLRERRHAMTVDFDEVELV